jgi:ABC-type Mn2+/Zn2+ transport system permease subunit
MPTTPPPIARRIGQAFGTLLVLATGLAVLAIAAAVLTGLVLRVWAWAL